MIPCKQCLKLAICRHRDTIVCGDITRYLWPQDDFIDRTIELERILGHQLVALSRVKNNIILLAPGNEYLIRCGESIRKTIEIEDFEKGHINLRYFDRVYTWKFLANNA